MGGITSITEQLETHEPDGLEVYTIRRKIQDTLQGHIYLLTTESSDVNIQPIVIKKTSKKLVNSGVSRQKIKIAENYNEELRILRNLSLMKDVDLGICRIVNNYIWNDNNNYYYGMEYCKGGDLFEYTLQVFQSRRSLTLSIERINTIKHHFQQLVRCVYYLHCNGIAHRDLSLENVMLFDENGEHIKVIDFGVAYDKLKHNNSWITSERVGKQNYMAPEPYTGMSYDARGADIFSLGVMLYLMMCGRHPFDRNKRGFEVDLKNLIDGRIRYQLKKQGIEQMFNDEIIDLLDRIFKYEKQRITMDEILTHSFVALHDYVNLYQYGNTTNEGIVGETNDNLQNSSSKLDKPNDNVSDKSYNRNDKMVVLSRIIINQNHQFL